MKLLLIISVFTSISAVKVPSAWQQNQNTNINNANRDSQSVRQQQNLPQPGPNYNNVNPFINNAPNPTANGLIPNGNLFSNLAADYNNWFNARGPNNGFAPINPINQINRANLVNNINELANNGNGVRTTPYIQQRQGPQRNYNGRQVVPGNPGTVSYNGGPGQVPYITYTTQRPAHQRVVYSTLSPIQNQAQSINRKQAYPQVNNPNTIVPITELDFSPLDPFPHGQLEQSPTQINNHNVLLSTVQPVNSADFSINNLFAQNPRLNNYQVPKPFHAVTNQRIPVNGATGRLGNLNFNPFTKNYRDQRTHEPTQYDPHYDSNAIPKVERLQSERAPIVENHEHLEDVPTRPIYPGEAHWSKPGVKYRPFVSKQQYSNLEEPNQQPDGFDTFLEAQNLFENQKKQFGLKLQQLPSIDNSPSQQSRKEENTEDSEIFVPTRLYAQVRHSEDEKHLPPESDENGRLKELVKDTKIQTIYSEEGYEDSAYDHAGHEKKAENAENFESDEKNKEAKEKKKIPVKKYNRQSASYAIGDQNLDEEDIEKLKKEELNLENEEDDDSEPAGTHYDEQSYLNKIIPTKTKDGVKKMNALIKPKEIKIVTAKDKSGGNVEMEVSSEVKAVPQSNNSTKFHKYVKIYPKLSQNVTNQNLIEPENNLLYPGKESKLDAERRSLTLDKDEIFIEEIINKTNSNTGEEYIFTTVPTEHTEIVTMEIPTTTEGTTSLPKFEEETEEKSIEILERPELKLQTRRKRSTVGLPKIEVDTDFIDGINHDLGKPTEKPHIPIEKKFPYYKAYKEKGLNENSPLRYSEDLKNVPKKAEGKLAFYELADKKMACSDVNPEVNPVPDRIQNADESVEDEEEDEEGNDPATKEPRLGKLGDKIDCFKMKYFGENPLDNPFFQEELVGPVKPIFSEIENISTKKIGESSTDNVSKGSIPKSTKTEPKTNNEEDVLHAAASNHAIENEIDDDLPYTSGLRSWFPGKSFGLGENTERDSKYINHFVEKNPNPKVNLESKQSNNDENAKAKSSKGFGQEVQTLPPLITTPKYTIELKPKHIYDQIELLEYLPEDELDEVKKAINAELPKLNITEMTTSSPNMNKTETVLNAPITKKKKKKKSSKKSGQRRAKVLKHEGESVRMETSDNGPPESFAEIDVLQLRQPKPRKPLYEIFDINKFIPKVPKIPRPQDIKNSNPNNYSPPVSIRSPDPTYQIFDINKYLPTTPFPLFKDFITRSTVLPKYKVISEVFYKENIKPNEQLNVFTDVLQHIRSFPKLKDSFPEPSEPISVKLKAEKISEEMPQNLFEKSIRANGDLSSTVTTIMSTFEPKIYANNHKYPQGESPISVDKQFEDMLNEFKTGNKSKRRRRIKTTTQETPIVIEESTSTLQVIGEPEVMGLMPPIVQGYKTIYNPKRDNSRHTSSPTIRIEERKINKYFVQGMRPPPKQKIYLYSDFITDNHIMHRATKPKRSKLRRSRRSAQRPAYAQVSRNRNKQPEETTEAKKEEEDDYVPNRTRNYHYDEKTGKIVYDKKPEEKKEEEEEVEYIEIVEETPTPKTTEKPKQSPVFATATPPPQGQSYTDFVKLLKSASNYKEIPDPTTTEKGAEEVTQQMVASTLEPVSTSPPEFLSILAKVRNDTTYKLIEDKKKTTTTAKPAEQEASEEEAESSEESQVDDIKNSPGGQGYEAVANLEIFDISDFLPNIKSYLPKTAIDTSKYKTIERPNMRHSLSSRYNSEKDKDLQTIKTNKEPILSNGDKASTKETEQPVSINFRATTSAPDTNGQKITRPSRRRTTTVSTTTAQAQDDAVSTTQATPTGNEHAASNDKPRRNYRRRPTRIKIKPTANETEADASKIVRRSAESDSNLHAEGNEQYEQIVERDGKFPSPPIRMDDYVDYEEISDDFNSTDTEQRDNIGVVAKKVVDVFKNYNKDEKHGGNYKKEDEVVKQTKVVAPIDTEQQNIGLVAKKVVDVFKNYNKDQKHGGNYKKEDEVIGQLNVAAPVDQNKKKESGDQKTSDKIKKNGKEKEDTLKPKEHAKPVLKKTDQTDVKKVEVFKNYDKTKKHGGNYRPANDDVDKKLSEEDESGLERNESIQIQNVNVFQDYDKTKKHGGNYKSKNDAVEELKSNIGLEKPILQKDVEVFKEYDETKKHGGNYKPERDTTIQEQQLEESQFGSPQIRQNALNGGVEKKSSVEIFKDYDKTKKHGGNYVRENESIDKEPPLQQQQPIDQTKDVDIFKSYDETKKTGGNYRREGENIDLKVDEIQPSASQFGSPQIRQNILNGADKKSSVEVFKDYDKTKKHGGNYLRENESIDKEPPLEKQQTIDQAKDVEIFKSYDETKKTGGNYRREDETIEPKTDETQYPNSKIPQTKRYVESRNDVQRLADSVIKPETIYSDLKLPLDINALKIVKDLPNEELEEIVKSAEDDDATEDVNRNDEFADPVVVIGSKSKISPIVEETTTTKKPFFIKDPSKRLYFYAPVR